MAIGNQASDNIDKSINRTAVPGMLNLRNILELVDDTLNDGAFPQKQLVLLRHQSIFHVLLQSRNELNMEGFQQLLEQRLRDISPIGNELAK